MKSPTPGRHITHATRSGSTTLIVTTAKQLASTAVHTSMKSTRTRPPAPVVQYRATSSRPAIYSPYLPLSMIIHRPLVRSRSLPVIRNKTKTVATSSSFATCTYYVVRIRTVHTSTGMGDRSRGFESRYTILVFNEPSRSTHPGHSSAK